MPDRRRHLLLVRHGATAWSEVGRYHGEADVPLSAAGHAQAAAVAAWVARYEVERVLASPLTRAGETAASLAAARGLEVEVDARLRDLVLGEWSGRTGAALRELPAFQAFRDDPVSTPTPAGDRILDVARRAGEAANELLTTTTPGTAVALVTHADVVRVLACTTLGADLAFFSRLHVPPGSVTVLSFDEDDRGRLERCGVTPPAGAPSGA